MLMALDIVGASQGIFVVLLFVVNKEPRNRLLKSITAHRKKKKIKMDFICEEEMRNLNT